jgi:DNA-binding protein Fis
VEREHILNVMRAVRGNKAAAARILGINRVTLYRKLAVAAQLKQ